MSAVPSPFIYWGQNSTTIYLRVALKDVETKPDVGVTHEEISVQAHGIGAHGDSEYKFCIKTYQHIAPEKCRLRITGTEILLDIPKREPTTTDNPWPRLTKDTTKRAWIKPDFDKMDVSEDEDGNADAELDERMKQEYLRKISGEIEETQEKVLADLKKHYLFSYSMFQLIAFSFISLKVTVGLAFTEDYNAYEDVGTALIISQIFSFVEVIHPLVGLVKTSFIPPLMQTCGRNFGLLVLIWNEPELQVLTATNYLVLFWSLAEIIRHPFYMASSMKVQFYWLTWLRYTSWVLLYPLGTSCEWIITWSAIAPFQRSKKFSIELPNSLNFSFSLTTYLYLHLIILPLGLAKLMFYMAGQRRKKLGSGNVTMNKKTN